jgi:hypothetical protein
MDHQWNKESKSASLTDFGWNDWRMRSGESAAKGLAGETPTRVTGTVALPRTKM